jgi:hypothetical protein
VDATASGETRADRADTIRGRLSAPTKESYCVIPTGNALLNCISPSLHFEVGSYESRGGAVSFVFSSANGILALVGKAIDSNKEMDPREAGVVNPARDR